MQYRTLGQTGVEVSCLCMGTMSFGGDADEPASEAMYRLARERGVNFFDTADVYARGRSEQILGRLIAPERDRIVLTSKVFGRTDEDRNARGLSRRHILRAIEASLRRLGTDRIDVYFCHQFDPSVAMEETLRAMDDLVRQGKVLYPAVSNWSAWQTARGLGIAERLGYARIECLQPMYNLAKRQAEVEILPLARAERLGVITYSPLGGGLLTGKYAGDRKPERGRLIDSQRYAQRYGDRVHHEVAERFVEHARKCGEHPASLAVAWVMSHPAVTAPIIGGRSVEQLEPSLNAVGVAMSAERRAEIAALSPEPPPATDRSEERGE